MNHGEFNIIPISKVTFFAQALSQLMWIKEKNSTLDPMYKWNFRLTSFVGPKKHDLWLKFNIHNENHTVLCGSFSESAKI